MKSAELRAWKRSSFSNGAWYCANGIEPESNQTSITSGTRRMRAPHCGHGKPTSSTNGRCGSSSRTPDSSSSSSSDPMHVRVLAVLRAAPHGQRCAPVALARQRPVDVAAQPVAHAPLADVLGVPVDLAVGLDQPLAQLGGRDVPRPLGVVHERVARAPAVRIGVLDRLGPQQPAAGAEVLDQVGVGVLDLAPGVGADALVVGPVGVHRVDDLQAVLLAKAEVVLAEGDRGVDEAGAVVGGDEVAEQDAVAALAVGVGLQVRERRLVAHSVERAPGKRSRIRTPSEPRTRSTRPSATSPGRRAARLGPHVDQLGVDRDRGVGDQRPRRGRPHEQLVARLHRAAVLDHGRRT